MSVVPSLDPGETPDRPPAVIQTHDLTKRFGDQAAVRDVTLDVPQGSIFGFIGPSGSGKTTTIRLLTGVYRPSAGRISVLGSDPAHFSQDKRARIGYMPQISVLYPNLTVWENLNFAASLYGFGLRRRKRLEEVLDFVELTGHTHKLTRNISGGMQRRLSLAATLVHRPDLIFLDEPTAGIDPVLRRKFWDHFRGLQDAGRTLFITTQYVSEAAYCDLVGVLSEGRLLAVDTPDGLRRRAYGGDVVELRTAGSLGLSAERDLRALPFVVGRVTRTGPGSVQIVVDEAATATPLLLEWAKAQGLSVEAVEERFPAFEDVFVELVEPPEGAHVEGPASFHP